MFRLIYRQRRRLLFGGFFGTLGMMMMAVHLNGGMASYPFEEWIFVAAFIVVSLIVALVIMCTAALLILVLPNWRLLIELFTINIFAYATIRIAVPGVFDIPYLGAILPFALYMMLFSLIYGEFSDRFRLFVDHREVRRFKSPRTAEALWAELVPDAGSLEEHWDILLRDLEPEEDDPDSLQAKYTHGGSLFELQTMTFLEKQEPTHAKYHHFGEVDPKNRSLVEGTYEIQISPLEDEEGCLVTLISHRNSMLLRTALMNWFDDELGDRTDHLRAQHFDRRDWSMTGRYRRKVLKFA